MIAAQFIARRCQKLFCCVFPNEFAQLMRLYRIIVRFPITAVFWHIAKFFFFRIISNAIN